jgi:hypothetical protein
MFLRRTGLLSLLLLSLAVLASWFGGTATGQAATGDQWDVVAQCESGGNWSINTGNGYRGGLQFAQSTWEGYGGTQYASSADLATPDQQKAVAENVLAGQGKGAWPECGQNLGSGGESTYAEVPPASEPVAPEPAVTAPPTSGPVVADAVLFQEYKGDGHRGVDLAAPYNSEIKAANGGKVVEAGHASGFGNWIKIGYTKDGVYYEDVYGHMEDQQVLVSAGQTIAPGEVIGLVGSAGDSTGPHLHAETWQGGRDNGFHVAPTDFEHNATSSAPSVVIDQVLAAEPIPAPMPEQAIVVATSPVVQQTVETVQVAINNAPEPIQQALAPIQEPLQQLVDQSASAPIVIDVPQIAPAEIQVPVQQITNDAHAAVEQVTQVAHDIAPQASVQIDQAAAQVNNLVNQFQATFAFP